MTSDTDTAQRIAAILAASLLFPWTAAQSSPPVEPGPSVAQDMLPLQFAQEYVRELAEQESLQAQADSENHAADGNPYASVVQYAAAMRFALSEDVYLLNNTHLILDAAFGHQLDSVPSLVARLYEQKMRILGSMSDIAGAFIAGPRYGVDYSSMAVEIPKLRAALESTDKGLLQTSTLVFAALVDPRPDKHGHVSRLSITCQQRGMLRSRLQADFGPKLSARNKTNLVAAAAQLDNLLNKNFKCADGPEYR